MIVDNCIQLFKGLNMKFANNIINSYKRLSYKAWYALAEYVDNDALEAYFNNKEELDNQLNK